MAPDTTTADTKPQPTRPALAAAVVATLKDAGVSRLEASERTGIPRETFYRKCRAGSPFDSDELALIALIVDTTVSDIVARAEKSAA